MASVVRKEAVMANEVANLEAQVRARYGALPVTQTRTPIQDTWALVPIQAPYTLPIPMTPRPQVEINGGTPLTSSVIQPK